MNPSDISFLQSIEGKKLLRLASQYPKIENRIAQLRKHTNSNCAALVSQQTYLRSKAQKKYNLANEMLFDTVGIEQSTREEVAIHVSKRFANFNVVADLTCGIGGDAICLRPKKNLFIVDCDKSKVQLCLHNLKIYGNTAIPIVANSAEWFPKADAYLIDPSRRNNHQRCFHLEDCEPGLKTIHKLLNISSAVAIKASPGLNYKRLDFPCEIEVISYGKECKQIMLWCGDLKTAQKRATLLPQNITLTNSENTHRAEITEMKSYLYEIEKAVLRAGLVDTIANKLNLNRICSRLSYLTSDTPIINQWVQTYKVTKCLHFSQKKIKTYIRENNLGHIKIKCRGFCDTEAIWKKRLGIKSKTKTKVNQTILFLTRAQNQPLAIFTEKIPS